MSAASQTPASSGKQRVLDAAHDLFAEGSYVEIGVALILEKAGVQAPTLYHHYGDKEGLFVVWAEQAFRNIENEVARHSRPGVSAKEGLCTYAWALLSSANFDLQQVLRDAPRLSRPESRDRVMVAYMRAIYEPLATLLVQAVATRELQSEPIAQLTDAFLGGLLALRKRGDSVESQAGNATWWCAAFFKAFRAG